MCPTLMCLCIPCRNLPACNASPEQGTTRGPCLHTLAVVFGTSAWHWYDLDRQFPASCSEDHNNNPGLHMVQPVTHHVSSCVIDPLCTQCMAPCLSTRTLLSCPPMHVESHLCAAHLRFWYSECQPQAVNHAVACVLVVT